MLGGVWAPLWSLSVLGWGHTLLCCLNKAAKAVQTVQLPAAVCNSGEGRQQSRVRSLATGCRESCRDRGTLECQLRKQF